MLTGISLTRVVSFVGFAVGCAFMTYVVRTMGYFSVVAPEYLGFFIETDLVMGAVRATPFVVMASLLLYSAFWLVSLMIRHEARVDRFMAPVDRVAQKLPTGTKPLALWIFYFAIVGSGFAFEGDYFIIRVALLYVNLIIATFFTVDYWIDHRLINPLYVMMCFFALFTALYETGKFEAINDLSHSQARYSITATDKTYVNVVLLRATANNVLLKVGSDIVLYERSAVTKIERSGSLIKLR